MSNVSTNVKSAVSSTGQGLWTRMPLWAKGLVVVGGGYLIYKFAKNTVGKTRLNPETRDAAQELDGWNKDFIEDSAQAEPTISSAGLKSMANTIHTAMDGYGTDEDAIMSQFYKVKNNADYSGLNVAWGKREISSGKWNPEPNLKNATLAQAVASEMSNYWRNKINSHLSKKGVKHRL